jgi:hypothetical protein
MPISPGYISSQPIYEDVDVTITMLPARPDLAATIDPPASPGLLVGFFNGALDVVELYMVSTDGARYIKVT